MKKTQKTTITNTKIMNIEDIEATKGERQLLILSLTILSAVLILYSYYEIYDDNTKFSINMAIFFYGLSVPIALLYSSLIDLDDYRIFAIWVFIGFIHLLIYGFNYDNPSFITPYHRHHHPNSFELEHISQNTIASLRALPIFLIAYKIFNAITKKLTDSILVQSFGRQEPYTKWSRYEIRVTDIGTFFNVMLYILILLAAIIKF